jgi:SAM-dependent methyltransferase
MSDKNDAYGQEIWCRYKGERSFEVVEREDGYVNVSCSADSYLSDYDSWGRHEKEGIRYAKGRCLDIGCGAGRVLLYLQKKRLYCLGIDTSPLAIRVCKLRGVKHAKVMAIENIGKFRSNSFDTIILFGNNFGLFANKRKAKRLLKIMYKITSPRGTIIAADRDPYLTDNPVHFKYHAWNRRRGRMPGQLRMRIRFMQYATPWYDYLYVSKPEMKGLLSETGWRVKRFIDAEGHRENGLYIAIIAKTAR